MQKRLVIIISLATCLVLSMAGFALAAGFSDTRGHWAEEQVNKWAESGLASGYADGTFKPNQQVSRAEFVALINRAFNIEKDGAAASFIDVKSSAWYYGDVAAAKTAGYIGGYSDGTFKPNSPITRQEVASILVRLLNIAPTTEGLSEFADAAQISEWSRGNIGAVAQKGLMRGMPDNKFMPLKSITRAEAVVSLDRALEYTSGGQKTVEPEPVVGSAIQGKVILDGQPVQKATVRVFKAGSYEVLEDIKTGNDGYYKLELKPGYYDITAVTEEEIAYQSDIQVTTNKITTVDLVMEQAAVVSGILKDKNDKAVKNSTVIFTTNPTFITTTNNQGKYTVPVAPSKTYVVRAYESRNDNSKPVIVNNKLSIGKVGHHDVGVQKVSFTGGTSSTSGGGGGGGGTGGTGEDTTDNTPPVLDSVRYTLNGQSYTINRNASNNYIINIPNIDDNKLSSLNIVVNEKSQTSLQVTDTDIGSINIAKIISEAGLNELKPVNGKITVSLDSIGMFLRLVDFSNYKVGTQKYIAFKLTDAYGNSSNFRVVINVVAAQ